MEATPPDSGVLEGLVERRKAFGCRLRDARLAHGCSVRALAQATRIGAHFIEALEAGRLDELPGEVFGRGFVRNLGRVLGLDIDAWVAAYDACWAAPERMKPVLEVEIKNPPFGAVSLRRRALGLVAQRLPMPRQLRRATFAMALSGAAIALGIYVARLPVWHGWLEQLKGSGRAAAPLASASSQPAAPPAGVAPAAVRAADAADEPAFKAAAAAGPAATSAPAAAAAAAAGAEDAGARRPQEAASAAPASVPAAPVKAAAAAPLAASALAAAPAPGVGGGDQELVIDVLEPVRVRVGLDAGGAAVQELPVGPNRFVFKTKADLMVYDAAAVKVSFNGRPLGSLGKKGRIRRLSFASGSPDAKKL